MDGMQALSVAGPVSVAKATNYCSSSWYFGKNERKTSLQMPEPVQDLRNHMMTELADTCNSQDAVDSSQTDDEVRSLQLYHNVARMKKSRSVSKESSVSIPSVSNYSLSNKSIYDCNNRLGAIPSSFSNSSDLPVAPYLRDLHLNKPGSRGQRSRSQDSGRDWNRNSRYKQSSNASLNNNDRSKVGWSERLLDNSRIYAAANTRRETVSNPSDIDAHSNQETWPSKRKGSSITCDIIEYI